MTGQVIFECANEAPQAGVGRGRPRDKCRIEMSDRL
jgi:hypothetical protein